MTGAFLFLVPIAGSGVAAWMVVLIVARESLVDGLRGFAESRGIEFGASNWGKAKMVSQSAAVIAILIVLANHRGESTYETIKQVMTAWALFATVVSGAIYVVRARKLLGRAASGERLEATVAKPTPAEAAR